MPKLLPKRRIWPNLIGIRSSGQLIVQVRRRSRAELLRRFDIVDRGQPVKALAHIGSPAFSYPFLEEAEAIFGDLDVRIPMKLATDSDGKRPPIPI